MTRFAAIAGIAAWLLAGCASTPVDPTAAFLEYQRGVAAAAYPDRLAEAQMAFDRAVRLNPALIDARLARVQLWQRFGVRSREDIAAEYESILRLQPGSTEAREGLARLDSDAEGTGEVARTVKPSSYPKSTAKDTGDVWEARGDEAIGVPERQEEAVQCYRRAVALEPSRHQLRLKLAFALLQLPYEPDRPFAVVAERHTSGAEGAELVAVEPARGLEASALLQKMSSAYIADANFWLCLSWANLVAENYLAARDAATRAIALNPANPAGFVMRGEAWQTEGDGTHAAQDFRRAASLAPNDKRIAEVLARLGAPASAGRTPPPMVATTPSIAGPVAPVRAAPTSPSVAPSTVPALSPAELREKAFDAWARGDLQPALVHVRQLLAAQPRDPTVWELQGNIHLDLRQAQAAVDDFDHAIQLDPKKVRFWVRRSRSKQDLQDWSGAIADFDQVIRLDNSHFHYRRRARLKTLAGDFDGALRDCETALHLSMQETETIIVRAIARSNSGDFQGALIDYDYALSLAPQDALQLQFFRNLERRRLRLMSPESALAQVADAATDSWHKAVATFLARGADEAKFIEAAEAGDPADVRARRCEAWYFAGMMRLLSDDLSGARERFGQSLATNASDSFEYALAKGELARLKAN